MVVPVDLLIPGYLKWDGQKYIIDPNPIGTPGVPGQIGPPGVPGVAGANGAPGPQGPTGFAGVTGATGPIGLTGPLGASNPTRLNLVSGVKQAVGTTLIVIGGTSIDMNDYPATYQTLNRNIYFILYNLHNIINNKIIKYPKNPNIKKIIEFNFDNH